MELARGPPLWETADAGQGGFEAQSGPITHSLSASR
jgi:hypothetical protein